MSEIVVRERSPRREAPPPPPLNKKFKCFMVTWHAPDLERAEAASFCREACGFMSNLFIEGRGARSSKSKKAQLVVAKESSPPSSSSSSSPPGAAAPEVAPEQGVSQDDFAADLNLFSQSQAPPKFTAGDTQPVFSQLGASQPSTQRPADDTQPVFSQPDASQPSTQRSADDPEPMGDTESGPVQTVDLDQKAAGEHFHCLLLPFDKEVRKALSKKIRSSFFLRKALSKKIRRSSDKQAAPQFTRFEAEKFASFLSRVVKKHTEKTCSVWVSMYVERRGALRF